MTQQRVYEVSGGDDQRDQQRAAAIEVIQRIADALLRLEQKIDQTLYLVNELGRRMFGDKAAPAVQAARSVAGFGKQLAVALEGLFGQRSG